MVVDYTDQGGPFNQQACQNSSELDRQTGLPCFVSLGFDDHYVRPSFGILRRRTLNVQREKKRALARAD